MGGHLVHIAPQPAAGTESCLADGALLQAAPSTLAGRLGRQADAIAFGSAKEHQARLLKYSGCSSLTHQLSE